MLSLKNIYVKYNDVVIDHQSIDFPSNSLIAIKGESGTGKTALLYRIGLISDHADYEYYYDNNKIQLNDYKVCSNLRRNDIGFVLQGSEFIEHFSVQETIQYYAGIQNIQLNNQEMQKFIDRIHLDISLNQNVMTLSLGEKQRLSIGCAILKNPKILILDEPTASLDEENENMIFNMLKELSSNMTVILSSHTDKIDEYADIIYRIHNKEIIKEKGNITDQSINHNPSTNIKTRFIKQYVNIYLNHYKKVYILMIMVFMLSFLSANILTSMITMSKEQAKTALIGQFENKLLILDDDDCMFIDEDIQNNIKLTDKNVYPVYQMKVTSGENEIYVLPYFDSDDFDKYLETSFSYQRDGVYMDPLTYNELQNQQISIEISDNHKIITDSYHINGVFKSSKMQSYTSDGYRFIYMPYSTLKDIYKESGASDHYKAYVALYDNYDELLKGRSKYISDGYTVNDRFIDIDSLNKIVSYYNKTNIMIVSIILLLAVIIDMALSLHMYFQRREEFALLKLRGFAKKNILQIILFEYLKEIIPVLLFTVLISVITLLLAGTSVLLMLMLVTGVFVFIILLERLLLYKFYISKIKIEYELRHD